MKINGDLIFSASGVLRNLTLASNSSFPASPNRGELYSLHGAASSDGFYHHDGTDWQNIPTIDAISELLALQIGEIKPVMFQPVFNARVMLNAVGIGNYWVINGAALVLVTAGIGAATLPTFWYDPAMYPTGTKFRMSINVSVNNTATSGSVTATVGLCKVLRPATTGGGTNLVIYTPDTPDIVSSAFIGLAAKAMLNVRTAEFTMPSTAGLYAFHINLDGSMNTTSHYDITLQAEM